MKAKTTLLLWVVLALAIAVTQGKGGISGQSAGTPAASLTASPVAGGATRSVLAAATPGSAPDQNLQLVRYDILPGTTLPAHTHPGTQIASIQAGALTYYVLTGRAEIHRGGTEAPEWLEAGSSTVLMPGDAVIERETMVHFGANLGTEPLVILAATLLEAGMPPSTVQATPAA